MNRVGGCGAMGAQDDARDLAPLVQARHLCSLPHHLSGRSQQIKPWAARTHTSRHPPRQGRALPRTRSCKDAHSPAHAAAGMLGRGEYTEK